MNNPTERGTDDPTGYAPKVGMSDYEIVRAALNVGVESRLRPLPKPALAALDRIEAKNLKQASSLLEAWAACEGLEAENARLTGLVDSLNESVIMLQADHVRRTRIAELEVIERKLKGGTTRHGSSSLSVADIAALIAEVRRLGDREIELEAENTQLREALDWLVKSRPYPSAECWAQATAAVSEEPA